MLSFLEMTLLMAIFIVIVYYISKLIVMEQEQQAEQDIISVKDSYDRIISQKDNVAFEKEKLSTKANEIFTLFEMTSAIARHNKEVDALELFKEQLANNLRIDDCHLFDHYSEDLKEFRSFQDYDVFPLRNKGKDLGFLVYRGLHKDDYDKFTILANQFALCLGRIRLYKEVEQLATTDSLTGVFTRRYFMERFEDELQRSSDRGMPLSVLMIDTDHFKSINDQYGHLVGDKVLQEVGRIIHETIREIDFVGRFGGEEFSVVLPNTAMEEALVVAERVRVSIEDKEIDAHDHKVRITVSVGLATAITESIKVDELLDKADWALYRAKKQGRNQICSFGIYDDNDS